MEKPNLPETTDFPEETIEWFEAWKNSSRTDTWDAPQWQYMFDTAIVHALIYASNQFNLLGELRARLAFMGLDFDPPKVKSEVIITDFDKIKERYNSGEKSQRRANS